MSRYIDAEPYKDCRIVLHKDDTGVAVKDVPTVDVAPVRHAHWITETMDYTEHRYKCRCSACLNGYECDSWRDPIDLKETDWCLWCGAKMDEEV